MPRPWPRTPPPATPALTAAMLAQMLADFGAELAALRQTQAEFDAFVCRQRRRHRYVLLFAASLTLLAWVCELSTLLRWWVLPIVLLLILVFHGGARRCQRIAAHRIARLTRDYRQTSRQLARAAPQTLPSR